MCMRPTPGESESLEETLRFFRARFARIYPLHLATLLFLLALQGSIVLFLDENFQIDNGQRSVST